MVLANAYYSKGDGVGSRGGILGGGGGRVCVEIYFCFREGAWGDVRCLWAWWSVRSTLDSRVFFSPAGCARLSLRYTLAPVALFACVCVLSFCFSHASEPDVIEVAVGTLLRFFFLVFLR